MRSQIKALRCPCGCDLPVHPHLEKMYSHLHRHYGRHMKVTEGVSCERLPQGEHVPMGIGLPSQIKLRLACYKTPDEMFKAVQKVMSEKFENYGITVHKRDIVVNVATGRTVVYADNTPEELTDVPTHRDGVDLYRA